MSNSIKDIVRNIKKGRPAEYNEENINMVLEELLRNKYIIDRNFEYLDGVALIASLITDFEKTMERIMRFYEKNSYYQDLYINNENVTGIAQENLNALLKVLDNNKHVPNVLMELEGLNYIPQLASLKKGEDSFINYFVAEEQVNAFMETVIKTGSLDDFKQIIGDGLTKFAMDRYNFDLFCDNPYFVAISLSNAYKQTLDLFKTKGVKIDGVLNKILEDKELTSRVITAIAKDQCHVYSVLNADKIPGLLPKMLELNCDRLNDVTIGLNGLSDLMEKLSDDDFKKIEKMVKEGYDFKQFKKDIIQIKWHRWARIDKGYDFSKAVEKAKAENFPLSMIPKQFILDDNILTQIFGSEDQAKFLKYDVHQGKYSKENELHLLKILKTGAKSLEEYIVSIKDKQREELSIGDLFAIEYYGKKCLDIYEITDIKIVDLFGSSPDGSSGKYEDDTKRIDIYTGTKHNSTKNILTTLHHEVAHAIQFSLMHTANIDVDDDIDLYTRDAILQQELPGYYSHNYSSISFEFDAEFRAQMLTNELYGTQEEFNLNVEKLFSIVLQERKEQTKEMQVKENSNFRYYNRREREYKGEVYYDIDVLFLETFSKLSYEKAKEYYDSYPMLKYSYDIEFNEEEKTFSIKDRSMEDYIKLAIETKNLKEKKIYFKLLEKEFDTTRYDKNVLKSKYKVLEELNEKLDNELLIAFSDKVKEELQRIFKGESYTYNKDIR